MHATHFSPRASERVPLQLRVDWWVDGSSIHFVSSTADVSRRGLLIGALSPTDVGARVRMRIPARGGEIELAGTVVHRGQRGMGVALDRTPGRPRRLLGEVIAAASSA